MLNVEALRRGKAEVVHENIERPEVPFPGELNPIQPIVISVINAY
jgi:hypothetical protein